MFRPSYDDLTMGRGKGKIVYINHSPLIKLQQKDDR